MAALIRVKRRIDEEPLNAFVLNCKKRKITNDTDKEKEVNEATDDEISTILRFAGTVKDGVRKFLLNVSSNLMLRLIMKNKCSFSFRMISKVTSHV